MDITDSVAISVSALDAQRRRLNVIASNLANAQSTHSQEGGPYRRRDVVFQSAPVASPFQRALRVSSTRMDGPSLEGVKVARVVADQKPGQAVYDPSIRTPTKRDTLHAERECHGRNGQYDFGTSRAYEANVQAIGATRAMWSHALEIGRS